MGSYAADFSAFASETKQQARVQAPDEHQEWPERPCPPAGQGSLAHQRLTLTELHPMAESFGREQKLTRRVEFVRAYSRGKAYATPWFVCHVLPFGDRDRPTRLGITASKRIRRAHDRNRFKRWAREVFRRERLRAGRNIVVRFRPTILSAEFGQFRAALVGVFERAGLYESPSKEKGDS